MSGLFGSMHSALKQSKKPVQSGSPKHVLYELAQIAASAQFWHVRQSPVLSQAPPPLEDDDETVELVLLVELLVLVVEVVLVVDVVDVVLVVDVLLVLVVLVAVCDDVVYGDEPPVPPAPPSPP
jgi:hypothetical protein